MGLVSLARRMALVCTEWDRLDAASKAMLAARAPALMSEIDSASADCALALVRMRSCVQDQEVES